MELKQKVLITGIPINLSLIDDGVIDIEKLYEKSKEEKNVSGTGAIIVQNLPNPVKLGLDVAKAKVTDKAIEAAQKLARTTAKVKLDTAAKKIAFEGPTVNSTADKLKLEVKNKADLNLGKTVKISAKDLKANINKMQLNAARLTLDASNKMAIGGTQLDIKGTAVKLKASLVQLG